MSETTEIHTRERNSSAAPAICPLFIGRPHGGLFAIHRPPADAAALDEAVLYIPPFAEEMNQSRRMATLQAEALTGLGYGVLTLDLTGCGDSAGEFAEARWETWRDDVVAGCRWLSAQGYRHISLWGLRLGAALAVETACAEPDICQRLVLWQPVVSGKTLLTQFLRLRVAAEMGAEGGGTTKSMRATLSQGETLEIAGYELSPDLAGALDEVNLSKVELPDGIELHWLEVVSDADRGPAPASQRVIDRWTEAGSPPAVDTVEGATFWSIQETTLVPGLIERTTSLF